MLISPAILLVGGVICVIVGRKNTLANRLGMVTGLVGGLPAMFLAAYVMITGQEVSLRIPWSVPFGSLSLALDSLSAFFTLAIVLVCGISAVYGEEYLKAYWGKKNIGVAWCFYNHLFASMLLLVTARNGVLFLVAWEVMSLTSFFLVMFEHEKSSVRRAGWLYLIATHLGTAFLLALFVMLGWKNRTLDFNLFAVSDGSLLAGVMFLLAVVGFGTKAGFMPMHVWLPAAHPAAPTHVSAVMSGVMIKMGVYGILRTLMYLGTPSPWWGWTLIGIGAVSGLVGVLFALAQRDLKALLAYSSVENMGIICLGLGLWLLGIATGNSVLAAMGLLGGLLHVWNHALFKSVLFLVVGAVAQATGTRDIEQMGGLLKRMRWTGLACLIGATAICGLPPLNGFVGEILIYAGAYSAVTDPHAVMGSVFNGLIVLVSLGLIGGLSVACFTKAFGMAFLGEPRSEQAGRAHDAPGKMRLAMGTLAGLCVLLGLISPLTVKTVALAARQLLPPVAAGTIENIGISTAVSILCYVTFASWAVIILSVALWALRKKLFSQRMVQDTVTWDCGYAAPNCRMQYTASSFVWPVIKTFRWLLRPRQQTDLPSGLFPQQAGFESHTDDVVYQRVYRPIFRMIDRLAGKLRWLQQGRNQLYVLYIALTLIVLLVWKLG